MQSPQCKAPSEGYAAQTPVRLMLPRLEAMLSRLRASAQARGPLSWWISAGPWPSCIKASPGEVGHSQLTKGFSSGKGSGLGGACGPAGTTTTCMTLRFAKAAWLLTAAPQAPWSVGVAAWEESMPLPS